MTMRDETSSAGWRPALQRALVAIVLATMPVAGSALAQQAPAGDTTGGGALDFGNSDKPIEVSAENGIEWRRDAKSYTARGNAIASQGDSQIFADSLTAYYGTGDNSIDRLVAEGHVRIQTPTQTATGDKADYDTTKKLLVMTGSALKIETPKETMTARDSLEYWQDRDALVARGDVYIIQGNTKIQSDIATGYFRRNDAGKKELYQIQADGNVRIDTGKETVTCTKAVYDPNTQIAVLTGNVVVNQGRSQFKGTKAEIDLKRGISRLLAGSSGDGRVHTIIQPKKSSSGGATPVTPGATTQ